MAKDRDFFVNARLVVEQAIGEHIDGTPLTPEPHKNESAAQRGRLGGLKGGKARAVKLTPAERRDIAKKAAKGRWKKVND